MSGSGCLKYCIVAYLGCLPYGALAGRPLMIDDADPVEPGRYEVEAGLAYERSPGCKHWDYPFGVTAGLFPGLEAGLGFGGQLEERTERVEGSGSAQCDRVHSIGDLIIGAKWQVVKECPLGGRHALVLTMKLPTADKGKDLGSGEPDNDVMWIMSRAVGDKLGVHLNAGYSWIGGPDADVLHYGVALDYQITDALQWVCEITAEKGLAGDAEAATRYNMGFRWSVGDGLTFDIAAGSKISGEAPDFTGTAGLTWAFGVNTKTTNGRTL
jgi:Putative MetA-pathway of phenol degradation